MLDSGETGHFVNDRNLLSKFKEDKEYIQMADNSKTKATDMEICFGKL